MAYGASDEMIRQQLAYREKRGEKIAASLQVEGMDDALLEKLTVLSGSLDPLRDQREMPSPLPSIRMITGIHRMQKESRSREKS